MKILKSFCERNMGKMGRIAVSASVTALMLSIIIAIFASVLAAIVLLLCMIGAICIAYGWMIFYLVIFRNTNKSFVFAHTHHVGILDSSWEDLKRKSGFDRWLERVTQEEISIKSTDGFYLYAKIIRNKMDSQPWVVVCHGYAYIGKEYMMFIAQAFHEMGYGVLLLDARGHGKSEGAYIGMGWPDRLDVVKWIHELECREKATEIVLFGMSMGASTVIMASGEQLPPTVKAVVADCGYTSVIKELSYQLKRLYHLPGMLSTPILSTASLITRFHAGYWLGEASAIRQIVKSQTPVFLIHGGADIFIPSYMLEELYNAAVCPKQKMIIEKAGHGESGIVDSERYWQAVSDFLQSVIERV